MADNGDVDLSFEALTFNDDAEHDATGNRSVPARARGPSDAGSDQADAGDDSKLGTSVDRLPSLQERLGANRTGDSDELVEKIKTRVRTGTSPYGSPSIAISVQPVSGDGAAGVGVYGSYGSYPGPHHNLLTLGMVTSGTSPLPGGGMLLAGTSPSSAAKQPAIQVIDSKHAIVVYQDPLVVSQVLAVLGENEKRVGGKVREHYHHEEQPFMFVVFEDGVDARKAAATISELRFPDGRSAQADAVARFTPARDPRTHTADSAFKNNVLVLKNVPFQLKQEALADILNNLAEKPTAINYHFDQDGTFRGMAFVKYESEEAAHAVFNDLQKLSIMGRDLRVEYKRKHTFDMNDLSAEARRTYEQLLEFKQNPRLKELTFPSTLTLFQRKQVHYLCEQVRGLVHFALGEGDARYLVVRKNNDDGPRSWQGRRSTWGGGGGGGGGGPPAAGGKKRAETHVPHSYNPNKHHARFGSSPGEFDKTATNWRQRSSTSSSAGGGAGSSAKNKARTSGSKKQPAKAPTKIQGFDAPNTRTSGASKKK